MDYDIEIRGIKDRLERLENALFVGADRIGTAVKERKPRTLPELIRNKKFKNGQQKVTVIVGYYEFFEKKIGIKEPDIEEAWIDGKFPGHYANELLRRAVKEGLVRHLKKKGIYDLTQTGEKYFNNFLNSND